MTSIDCRKVLICCFLASLATAQRSDVAGTQKVDSSTLAFVLGVPHVTLATGDVLALNIKSFVDSSCTIPSTQYLEANFLESCAADPTLPNLFSLAVCDIPNQTATLTFSTNSDCSSPVFTQVYTSAQYAKCVPNPADPNGYTIVVCGVLTSSPSPSPSGSPSRSIDPSTSPSSSKSGSRSMSISITPTISPSPVSSVLCRGKYQILDTWCDDSCNHLPPFCPITHCNCAFGTRPRVYASELVCVATAPVTASWCEDSCNHIPPFCPSTFCTCTSNTVDEEVNNGGNPIPPSYVIYRSTNPIASNQWCTTVCNQGTTCPSYCVVNN